MPGRNLSQQYAESEQADYASGDAESVLLRAQLSVFRQLMGDYSSEVRQLADGTFYWHLWHRAERVNGGLSETPRDARNACWRAAVANMYRRDCA